MYLVIVKISLREKMKITVVSGGTDNGGVQPSPGLVGVGSRIFYGLPSEVIVVEARRVSALGIGSTPFPKIFAWCTGY